jgi:hypothetical protein
MNWACSIIMEKRNAYRLSVRKPEKKKETNKETKALVGG